MCIRLWILIVLVIWLGQWIACLPESVSGAEAVLQAALCPEEDLAGLVAHQANRRAPRLPLRSRSRRRRRRRRRQRPYPRVVWVRGAGKDDEELSRKPKPKQQPKGTESNGAVFNPQRWGVSAGLSRELPDRLYRFWEHYYECFRTETRNTAGYAYHYLSALLRMETKRNYTNIGRATGVAGENVQHFMSNSPWSRYTVVEQVRKEIESIPELAQGSVLILDESADQAGEEKAGAARQYNGRFGQGRSEPGGRFLGLRECDLRRPPVVDVGGWRDVPDAGLVLSSDG